MAMFGKTTSTRCLELGTVAKDPCAALPAPIFLDDFWKTSGKCILRKCDNIGCNNAVSFFPTTLFDPQFGI